MASPTPEPDWLDDAINGSSAFVEGWIAWTLDQMDKIGTAIINFMHHHWLLLVCVIALWLFARRFLEWRAVSYVVVEHEVRTRFTAMLVRYQAERRRAADERERAWMSGADESDFRDKIGQLKQKIRRHEDIHGILRQRMKGRVAGEKPLAAAALRHKGEADRLRVEITRLEQIWASQRVLNLVDRVVHGDDAEAQIALARLNAIWRTIDFRLFVPYDALNAADQKRFGHLFGIVASTTFVAEARKAFAVIQKMLESYQFNWGEAA